MSGSHHFGYVEHNQNDDCRFFVVNYNDNMELSDLNLD